MNSKTIHWHNTIRMKVILMVIVSCVIVLGSLSFYNTYNEQSILSDELNKLADVTTQRLSKHLIAPMWDLDKELVEEIIEAEMLEDKIHAIIIWDKEVNKLFAARERSVTGALEELNGAISGDFIKSTSLVNNGSQDIGEVQVFLSKQELNDQFQAATLNGIITMILLIVFMVIIMTVAMSRMIITPIKHLAKHADDISHGNLKQDIKVESSDEIGQLAEAFQRMQFSLRVAFKRIQSKSS
jgi:methyl-accepting chemotaxis protein